MDESSVPNINRRTPCWRNIVLSAFVGLLVVSLFAQSYGQVSVQAVSLTLLNLSAKSVENSAYTIVIGLLASTLLLGLIWLFFQRRFPGAAM